MKTSRKLKKGNLFVISAPSGAGKTTLRQKLCERFSDIKHSVSYTTRKPRAEEVDGVDYTFVSKETFLRMVEQGEFLEWAEVHGNLYGTSKKRIDETLAAGLDMILDIDVQGARQIRNLEEEVVSIFVMPPSLEALKERLFRRMTDSKEVIEARLKKAVSEIMEYKNYDYVIVNELFEEALQELLSIIITERARVTKINQAWIDETFLKEDSTRWT